MSGNSDRVLSNQELRTLQVRSDRKGWERLGIHLGFLIAAGALVAASSGWLILAAVFVLGLVQVALFAPAHETMHQTAFASRRTNAIVGWLTSCPSLLNWHFYTAYHLAHHRNTQIAGLDPELMAEAPVSLRGYILRVLGVPFWTFRLKVVWDCWRGDLGAYQFISVAAAPKIVRSVRAMTLVMVGGAVAAGQVFGWTAPLLYWIAPQLLGQPPLRAYLLAEHTGCTEDRNGLTNTRTTLTCAPVRLLMWNMPYHAEHHLFPSIPFHRLVDAHALIRAKLSVLQPGYIRWNIGFVQSLLRRSGSSQSGLCGP
jgi:fatty acid desaturase